MSAKTMIVLLALSLAGGAAAADEIDWQLRPGRAFDEARAAGRPVMIDVWAVWCQPCKEMDKTTYRDPRVVAALDEFVPVKIDADIQQNLIQRYRVEAYPTVLMVDGDGDEITRMVGLVSARALLASLAAVRSGYDDYLTAKSTDDDSEALESMAIYLARVGNEEAAADCLRRALRQLKRADPQRREPVELSLAQVLLDDDNLGPAAKTFERLYTSATLPEIRAAALAGLHRVALERGREERAFELASQVWEEFPELAAGLLNEAPPNR